MELRVTEWHVRALNILLIATIAYFAALNVEDIIARALHGSAVETPGFVASIPPPSGVKSSTYYNQIVHRDIFNLVPQASAPAPVVEEDLHLKLLGTSKLSRTKPYAIIEDQTGEQALYRVGEEIPDAGKLIAVETTSALIDHNGKIVSLQMPKDDMPSIEAPPMRPDFANPAFRRHNPNFFRRHRGAGPPESLNLQRTGPNSFSVNRSDLMSTVANPAQLMTEIRAVPNVQDGTTTGFTLSEIVPGSVFAQLGLQEGDVLTGINGQPVNNPLQAVGMLTTIGQQPSVDVTVTRDGQPISLHVDIH
jgi:general secretion pathway protein C